MSEQTRRKHIYVACSIMSNFNLMYLVFFENAFVWRAMMVLETLSLIAFLVVFLGLSVSPDSITAETKSKISESLPKKATYDFIRGSSLFVGIILASSGSWILGIMHSLSISYAFILDTLIKVIVESGGDSK